MRHRAAHQGGRAGREPLAQVPVQSGPGRPRGGPGVVVGDELSREGGAERATGAGKVLLGRQGVYNTAVIPLVWSHVLSLDGSR